MQRVGGKLEAAGMLEFLLRYVAIDISGIGYGAVINVPA